MAQCYDVRDLVAEAMAQHRWSFRDSFKAAMICVATSAEYPTGGEAAGRGPTPSAEREPGGLPRDPDRAGGVLRALREAARVVAGTCDRPRGKPSGPRPRLPRPPPAWHTLSAQQCLAALNARSPVEYDLWELSFLAEHPGGHRAVLALYANTIVMYEGCRASLAPGGR